MMRRRKRILIAGSASSISCANQKETYSEICRNIGATLARSFDLVFCGTQEPNADFWAINGALSSEPKCIRLHSTHEDQSSIQPNLTLNKLKQLRSGSFVEINHPKRGGVMEAYQDAFTEAITSADLVLLFGGNLENKHGSTSRLFHEANLKQKPVVVIYYSGTTSERLWDRVELLYKVIGLKMEEIDCLRNPKIDKEWVLKVRQLLTKFFVIGPWGNRLRYHNHLFAFMCGTLAAAALGLLYFNIHVSGDSIIPLADLIYVCVTCGILGGAARYFRHSLFRANSTINEDLSFSADDSAALLAASGICTGLIVWSLIHAVLVSATLDTGVHPRALYVSGAIALISAFVAQSSLEDLVARILARFGIDV